MDRLRIGLASSGHQVASFHSNAQAAEGEQCKRLRAAFLNRFGSALSGCRGDLLLHRYWGLYWSTISWVAKAIPCRRGGRGCPDSMTSGCVAYWVHRPRFGDRVCARRWIHRFEHPERALERISTPSRCGSRRNHWGRPGWLCSGTAARSGKARLWASQTTSIPGNGRISIEQTSHEPV
jgi:hypothetical protein